MMIIKLINWIKSFRKNYVTENWLENHLKSTTKEEFHGISWNWPIIKD